MMKKRFLAPLVMLALACPLLVIACPPDPEDPQHTDPAFLVGSWEESGTGKSFTIDGNYGFKCVFNVEIDNPQAPGGKVTMQAEAEGNLNYTAKNLGINDYLLTNMGTTNNQDYPANSYFSSAVSAYSDTLIVTMKPNAAKDQFTLTAPTDPTADEFFGGTFTKK
jgi:hypothetical protein